jgi:hypothetical protein
MRPKDCSQCAKMRLIMIFHLTDQGSDHRPGSTPGKVSRSLICSRAPVLGAITPQPRVVTLGYFYQMPSASENRMRVLAHALTLTLFLWR